MLLCTNARKLLTYTLAILTYVTSQLKTITIYLISIHYNWYFRLESNARRNLLPKPVKGGVRVVNTLCLAGQRPLSEVSE